MIRPVASEDYEMLCQWWEWQNFPPPPKRLLPSTGWIANEVAAGFLYLSNSPIAWFEWIVSDPKAAKRVRDTALDDLIRTAHVMAKAAGSEMVLVSTKHPVFPARLKRHGYVEGDRSTNHYVKNLGE